MVKQLATKKTETPESLNKKSGPIGRASVIASIFAFVLSWIPVFGVALAFGSFILSIYAGVRRYSRIALIGVGLSVFALAIGSIVTVLYVLLLNQTS